MDTYERVVGRNYALVCLGIAGCGLAVLFCYLTGKTGKVESFGFVSTALGAGALGGNSLLFASSRVIFDMRARQYEIRNSFSIVRGSLAHVKDLDVDNGLQIVLTSGRVLRSTAYGESVLNLMTGNKRAKNFYSRLVSRGLALSPTQTWEATDCSARPRWAAAAYYFGGAAVGLLLALLVDLILR